MQHHVCTTIVIEYGISNSNMEVKNTIRVEIR